MTLRHFVIAILSVILCWGPIALAQQTQSSLDAEINANLPSTNRNVVAAAQLRTTLHDMNAASPLTQVNAQTGTSYTFAPADYNQLVTFNNAGAVAVALPPATGRFATWKTYVRNIGAGTVTVTPTGSTINGNATLAIPQSGSVLIVSDGINYQTFSASIVNNFSQLAGNYTLAQGPTIGANTVLGSVAGGTPAALSGGQLTALSIYTPPGTGGVARTIQQTTDRVLSFKEYGAVGDGVADDTTAIQNALNEAVALGSAVYCEPGTYKITTAVSITAAVKLYGDNFSSCIIAPAITIDAFDISTVLPVKFDGIGISYPSAANNGTTAIKVTAAGGQINSSSIFRDIQILNASYCIQFIQADAFVVDNIKCVLFTVGGVLVQNNTNADAGDSTITNSYLLAASSAATACVQWISSGGFRFENDKCLTAANGIAVELASAAVTAQMIVVGNSFDGMTASALTMVRQGATGNFARVLFNDNLCNGVLICVQIPNDSNGAWLKTVTILGNSYIGSNSASAIGFDVNQVDGLIISNNMSHSQNSATINIHSGSANNSDCIIGPNMKVGTFAAGTVTPCSANQNLIAPSGI